MSLAIKLGFCARNSIAGIGLALVLWLPAVVLGQTNYYAASGSEYAITGSMPGDQVHPDVAVSTNGGFVVWQDNVTDGDGWGISATRLDSPGLSPDYTWWDKKVNVQTAGDQENPRVALLQGGGAVFVWQGGPQGFQHIYARFISASNTWMTEDVMVNASSNYFQINPAVATLANGNVVIVWASYNEAGSTSMQDVYGRIFSPAGVPLESTNFLINQFTPYNQRTPAVAALANGGFVVAWVSEQERTVAAPTSGLETPGQMAYPSVDIYARLYNNSGDSQGGEFLVNSDFNPCANPDVAAGSDGGFVIIWDARDMSDPYGNGLDIYDCAFNSAGAVVGTVMRLNSYLYGDQYGPRIAAQGTNYLSVWMSLTPQQGIYGQFLQGNGSTVGNQIQVNGPLAIKNIQPVVASDGASQFLALWTGFTGLQYSYDLFAQRYVNLNATLSQMPAPFVYAPFVISNNVYQPELVVSWAPVGGISVSNYEVYVNGAATPAAMTTNNVWTMTAANGLTASSSNYFQVDYVTADGRRSPISAPFGAATWSGLNWGGIPYEWMAEYFNGYNNGTYYTTFWPSASAQMASGGPTLLQVFLGGGNPYDSSTWLHTTLSNTHEGMILSWNTQPGFTYQVQTKTNLAGDWTNLDAPRFAPESSDQINVGGTPAGYYRVLLLRQ